MFHELIFALNGYAGDVFQFDGKKFYIRTDFDLKSPLLHSSELIVLNDVLEIASLYKGLIDFLESQQAINLSWKASEDSSSSSAFVTGVYVRAICNGLRELLKGYVEAIASLELEILNDPYITLNHIRVQLEPFRTLFRVLTGLVSTIKAQGRSTCNLVEVVKSEYDNNIPLQDSLKILIPWVHRTLFKQITNWVVFGNLADPTQEFFIQLRKDGDDDSYIAPTTPNSTPINPKRKPIQRNNTPLYCVNYSVVPSHFSVPLVERILFLGNSVSILEKSDKTRGGLLEKQKVFFEMMQKLPLNTFRTEDLSDTIDELGSCIGKELHRLVVTETDLPKHLGIVKDFYLCGRGELFHDFLQTLIRQSSNPEFSVESMEETKGKDKKDIEVVLPSKRVHLDIKGVFALAASRVQVQEDILHKIEILAPADVLVENMESVDKCISRISLKLEQEWPLHILFTPESMERYNELFRFLLRIRLLQLQLLSIWTETKRMFRFIFRNGPAQLLINMTYFVNNLQYYLQADVLESQYSILMAAVDKSENFDQIRVAHAKFQSNIWAQSFRTLPKLYEGIHKMIEICRRFCMHMDGELQAYDEYTIPICESSELVQGIRTQFNQQVELLLAMFKALAGNPQVGPYLGQLLLRLDFNYFFTNLSNCNV